MADNRSPVGEAGEHVFFMPGLSCCNGNAAVEGTVCGMDSCFLTSDSSREAASGITVQLPHCWASEGIVGEILIELKRCSKQLMTTNRK